MLRSNAIWSTVLFLAVSFGFGPMDARAQVYGTDYLAFHGRAFVLDNPTSPACMAVGIYYNYEYTFVYRYIANPVSPVTTDSLALYIDNHGVARMIPTTAQSLNGGPVAITWSAMNRWGNMAIGVAPGNSTMTIVAGDNSPVTIGTSNIVIAGQVENFLGWPGCTVMNLYGAGVAMQP